MIDLHMHTTASDGRSTPEDLVRQAYEQGIRILSVTDHDTMAGVPRAAAAAARCGLTVVPGIEITSVDRGSDVHVLAYFLPVLTEGLRNLLAAQRANRLARAQEIAGRLAAAGAPIDFAPLIEAAAALGGKSLARPQIAQALIAAGHVCTVAEAFEKFLAEDRPAYVPHCGASPMEVVELITAAGGVASLAHPGHTRRDEIIADLVAAGMTAIEAYHSSHDTATTARNLEIARTHDLAVSGGSDFHGEGTRRSEFFGVTTLPRVEYDRLAQRGVSARALAAEVRAEKP